LGTYKRLPRGKKKATNELTTFAEKAYAWVLMNWRQIAWASLAALLIFGVVIGVHKYYSWRTDRAADALASAQLMDSTGARSDALTAVANDYSTTDGGREAVILLGNAARTDGRIDDAIMWFELLVDRSNGYPILKTYAYQNLGQLYAQQKKWTESAAAYHEASLVKGNQISAFSFYEEAVSLEKLGDLEHAEEIYQSLLDDDVDATIKAQSEERLLWLNAHRRIEK